MGGNWRISRLPTFVRSGLIAVVQFASLFELFFFEKIVGSVSVEMSNVFHALRKSRTLGRDDMVN